MIMRIVNFAATAFLLAATLALPASACIVPGQEAKCCQRALDAYQSGTRPRRTDGSAPSPVLDRAAQRHACDNAAHNRMSHTGSDGSHCAIGSAAWVFVSPRQRECRAGFQ
jgi:hypothetical protein